jgi:regulation of enolase protein 1 (concanavalin A-like superfamily)
MRVKWLRSALLPLLVVTFVSSTAPAPSAQLDHSRPSVELTQYEEWAREAWPADVNRDGVTDIIAGYTAGLTVVLGHGDGTFGAPRVVAADVTPIGVGDLDGDGLIDVIGTQADATAGSIVVVVPGHGDGTFGLPRASGATALVAPAYVLDMDNDGVPDLVAKRTSDAVAVYPGHGDFTLGAPVALRGGTMMEASLIPADLNADGLPDVAFTSKRPDNRLDIYFNLGGFAFTNVRAALPADGGGITARDMNRDGLVDLIVGHGTYGSVADVWQSGSVSVYLGQGGGTFAPPITSVTNNGPVRVVAGDFNGDGIPDVATGNRSDVNRCGGIRYLPDSVSILLGRGDGSLHPAASFALDAAELPEDRDYSRVLHRLNTSDLDGDGRTDLITSPGVVLLLRPPSENRPPVVDAGPDIVAPMDINDQIAGAASDPDYDWLTYEWRDQFGFVLGDTPTHCFQRNYSGTVEFTLTADDGRGGVTGDSKIRTFGTSVPLPPEFTATSIGDAIGTQTVNSGGIQVFGSGADIWDSSDAFHFLSQQVRGDFHVSVRLSSLTNLDPWTKAGLMVRQSLTPDSRHVSLFGTPTSANGVAFQSRPYDGGASEHTYGPAVAPPIWLRLVREGDRISAYTRVTESDPWALTGTQTLRGLTDPVHVGLAVTSHVDGQTSARATFTDLSITGTSPPSGELPAGWTGTDVGSPAAGGSATYAGGTYLVQGSGADIWETQDAFHYAYVRLPGDGILTARVADVAGPHEWTKAGLMIRQSLDAAAAHQSLLVTEANGLAHQWRPAPGAASLHTGLAGTDAPAWFRIERSGGVVRLAYSLEAGTPAVWTPIAESPFPTGEVLIGLAVTSHADGLLATGTFDNVSLITAGTPGPVWTSEAIGAISLPGSSTEAGGVYTLSASGVDIWDFIDGFRYTYRTLAGDGTIIARLTALDGVHPWTKAGVMIRASTDPSAAHGFMLLSRDNGLAFQRRTAHGTATTHTAAGGAAAPIWLRLTRTGTTIAAAWSFDGSTWVDAGSDTLPIGSGPVLAGLALTSHDDGALATATFDQVAVVE